MKLTIVIAVLVIAILAYRWFVRTPPQQVSKSIKKAALYGGGAVLVLLALTGRLHWLFALLGGLAPFAQRLFGLLRSYQSIKSVFSQVPGMNRGGPNPNPTSTIETAYLRMNLDHASGVLSGVVLAGRHKGQTLEELDMSATLEVLAECRVDDDESVALLEAYLDRRFGTDWHSHQRPSDKNAPTGGAMTREEAYAVLGLNSGADASAIREAHRRLMQRFHPDRGGSTYLAAKINQAKDLLVRDAA